MGKVKSAFSNFIAKIKKALIKITEVGPGTWIRLILLLVSIINRILVTAGVNTLPFTDEDITELVSDVFIVLVMIVSFWKNNSFTEAAIKADKYMKVLKKKK